MHKFNPEKMKKLDSEERRALFHAGDILSEAGLKPGMTVADIGCGTGFFTFAASDLTGSDGMVYALDTQEPMIAELQKRIEAKGIKNIRPVVTQEYGLLLTENSADMAFVAFVLHEVEDKLKLLREILRIVKAGGNICILEWKKILAEKGPAITERISEDEAGELLLAAGFREIRAGDYNAVSYNIFAQK